MQTPHRKTISVIGSGVAGAAIAQALIKAGHTVTLLFRGEFEGASFTNQKWQHSGLLYPKRSLARKAWAEYTRRPEILRDCEYRTASKARFLTLNQSSFEDRRMWWGTEWKVEEWELPWRVLDSAEYLSIGEVGGTKAVGGFETPDSIVDFPKAIRDLRADVAARGGRVIGCATVDRILVTPDGKIHGVDYLKNDSHAILECDSCVLAIGGWTHQLLIQSEITLSPRIISKKCVVLDFEGELVPSITTCLDIRKGDGSIADVTLVPFHGKTPAAGNSWEGCEHPDTAGVTADEERELLDELSQCFSSINDFPFTSHVCIKTEKRVDEGKAPSLSPKVYGKESHEVDGLLVVLPGKASFMFDVADAVCREMSK